MDYTYPYYKTQIGLPTSVLQWLLAIRNLKLRLHYSSRVLPHIPRVFLLRFLSRTNLSLSYHFIPLASRGKGGWTYFFPAFNVFSIKEQIVIGPTPPGTGVMYEHFGATFS